jgi:ubiquinone biosynthesis protein UbiJ
MPAPPDASPDAERIEALESKVRELEARIEKLEQTLSERDGK